MGPAAVVVRLAWRNLWRNLRRTTIMLAAVVVGVWAMIFMIALMRGMVDDMLLTGIRSLPGHVQIHHPRFRDDPTVNNLLPRPGAALLAALDQPDVVAWSSRVRVPAVIMSERSSRGVTLVGIDPVPESGLSFVAGSMAEGRFLTGARDAGLILGRRLVDRLETGVGKRVVVMTQDPDNEIADRGFRLVGVYEAAVASTEEAFAFAGRETLQSMLGVGDQVSEIAVLGNDYRDIDALHQRLSAAAGDEAEVLPWSELAPHLSSMLGVMDGFVLVWIVIVFLALSFGLVNTLVMAVFERVREIGLMMALGVKPGVIRAQVLAEAVMLLGVGTLIGDGLAWASIQPLRGGIDLSGVSEGMDLLGVGAVLTPVLRAGDVALATGVVLILGLVASLSPAIRASRYHPVEAISKA
ncbi:MAG: ABC transporter permease [Rhodospirillaceae bacterium]|nr:ABC transporter permease [Rhodospirillaceae bacterium]